MSNDLFTMNYDVTYLVPSALYDLRRVGRGHTILNDVTLQQRGGYRDVLPSLTEGEMIPR